MIKKLLVSAILLLIFPILGQSKMVLVPYQYLKTSGARDITPFTLDGAQYLAIPQLSKDESDTPANINGGKAKVDVLIFKWVNGKLHLYQKILGHGNEGTAFLE